MEINWRLFLSVGILNNLTSFLDRIFMSDRVNHIIVLYESKGPSSDVVSAILSSPYSNYTRWSFLKLNYTDIFNNKKWNDYKGLLKYQEHSILISVCMINGDLVKILKKFHDLSVLSKSLKHLILLNSLNVTSTSKELSDNHIVTFAIRKFNVVCIRWNSTIEVIRYRLFEFELNVTDSRSVIFVQNRIYDELFFDKSLNLNGHDFIFLLAPDPPRTILLKSTSHKSKIKHSLGGSDAFLGLILGKFFNATIKYVTFNFEQGKDFFMQTSYLNEIVRKEFLINEELPIEIEYNWT